MKNLFYTLLITLFTLSVNAQNNINYRKAFKKSYEKIDLFLLNNGFSKSDGSFFKAKSITSKVYANDTLQIIVITTKHGFEAFLEATHLLWYERITSQSFRRTSLVCHAYKPKKVYIIKHV